MAFQQSNVSPCRSSLSNMPVKSSNVHSRPFHLTSRPPAPYVTLNHLTSPPYLSGHPSCHKIIPVISQFTPARSIQIPFKLSQITLRSSQISFRPSQMPSRSSQMPSRPFQIPYRPSQMPSRPLGCIPSHFRCLPRSFQIPYTVLPTRSLKK